MSRALALRGNVLDQSQRPFIRIDGKDCNAVMAAVRGIEKLAGRMDLDLSILIQAGEAFRDGGDGLQRMQNTTRGVVIENGNCRPHLVDHISELSVGMKREVSGPVSGTGFGKWRIVKRERAFCTVKFVDQRFVEAEIVHNSETIVGG